jgi:hypothetical protein
MAKLTPFHGKQNSGFWHNYARIDIELSVSLRTFAMAAAAACHAAFDHAQVVLTTAAACFAPRWG